MTQGLPISTSWCHCISIIHTRQGLSQSRLLPGTNLPKASSIPASLLGRRQETQLGCEVRKGSPNNPGVLLQIPRGTCPSPGPGSRPQNRKHRQAGGKFPLALCPGTLDYNCASAGRQEPGEPWFEVVGGGAGFQSFSLPTFFFFNMVILQPLCKSSWPSLPTPPLASTQSQVVIGNLETSLC